MAAAMPATPITRALNRLEAMGGLQPKPMGEGARVTIMLKSFSNS